MKTQLKNGLSVLALAAFTLFSCESEESVQPDQNDEIVDQTARQVILQEGLNSLTGIGGVYGNFEDLGFNKLSTLGRSKSKSINGRAKDDDTCALVTIKENADGSYSLILDFGEEGCVDNETLIKGIATFTGYETDSTGTLKVEFDNFSEEPVDGSEDDDPFVVNGSYEGSFAWNPEAGFNYSESYKLDVQLDYKDGKIENIKANGEALGNEEEYIIREHSVDGTNNFGDQYLSEVTESLVYSLSCESDIFVSGVQKFSFNEDSATVDYGEGSCDNILTISAPGITITIDLDKYEGA
ncbi:MAG: hypothetical protein AAF693_16360 [Bacteroidota bacterium]